MDFKLSNDLDLQEVSKKYKDIFIHVYDFEGNLRTIDSNKIILAANSSFFDKLFETRKFSTFIDLCFLDINYEVMVQIMKLIMERKVTVPAIILDAFVKGLKHLGIEINEGLILQQSSTSANKVTQLSSDKDTTKVGSKHGMDETSFSSKSIKKSRVNHIKSDIESHDKSIITDTPSNIQCEQKDSVNNDEKGLGGSSSEKFDSTGGIYKDNQEEQETCLDDINKKKVLFQNSFPIIKNTQFADNSGLSKFLYEPVTQAEVNKEEDNDNASDSTVTTKDSLITKNLPEIFFEMSDQKGKQIYICEKCGIQEKSFWEASAHFEKMHQDNTIAKESLKNLAFSLETEIRELSTIENHFKVDKSDENRNLVLKKKEKLMQFLEQVGNIRDSQINFNLRKKKEEITQKIENKIIVIEALLNNLVV